MNAANVSQICCWLRITEVDLFRAAYKWMYDTDGYIEPLIVEFSLHDKVPPFVVLFVRKHCYPRLFLKGALYENPLRPYHPQFVPRIPKR